MPRGATPYGETVSLAPDESSSERRERAMPVSAHRLAEVPLFAGLPPEPLESLARASLLRRYQNGQVLCSEGDPGEALYVLEEGRLRVSRFASNGQEAVQAVVEA